ncbi:MAG: hypothetical protein ACNS63_07565 [Candidatus Nitrospinota bacterium M3_3B_026]
MKSFDLRPARFLLLFAAFVLAACGAEPGGTAPDSASDGAENRRAFGRGAPDNTLARERELRENPACGRAGEEFVLPILYIVDRFNEFVSKTGGEKGMALLPAGHPDSPDGVSVLVCRDEGVAAYAYGRTVVLGGGLLAVLRDAARSAVVYNGDDAAIRARLDHIAARARMGDFSGIAFPETRERTQDDDGAREAEELFTSATAFVLFHELAHTQAGQEAAKMDYPDPYAELKADIFAAEVMRPTGFSMEGVDLVFEVLERLAPGESIGHLPPWERARAVKEAEGDYGPLAFARE